ncbi:MAG: hypothetical protein IJA15_06160 [Clostridia bacterium]|nr:hypothetical protein [Clostridia bacterium]
MNKKRTANAATKVITYLLIILVFLGAIGFIFTFTNGFNEDFKTFYIEHNGVSILSSEKKLVLERGKTHRFNTKYTFDFNKEEAHGYHLSIVANQNEEQSFDFTVDGETYAYYEVGDLTDCFKIVEGDDYFTIEIPEKIMLEDILKAKYSGSNVEVPEEALKVQYPFTLVVSSYNEEVTYNLDFAFYISVTGVEFEKEVLIL